MSNESSSREKNQSAMRWLLPLLPIVVFGGLAAIAFMQLTSGRDTSVIPSAYIGKPAPKFELPPLPQLKVAGEPAPGLRTGDLKGKLHLVNIFASWCAPCRAEHPVLMKLAEDERLDVVGINYKDDPGNALRFLGQLGNPYTRVGVDPKGRTAIEWGFYGIPETLLVDHEGIVRHKVVGPITKPQFDILLEKINGLSKR